MQTIEVGSLKIHLEGKEDALDFIHSLMRPLSNKEIAGMIGVSERTVARWKTNGRLPSRLNGQIYLVDLLNHILPEGGDIGETCIQQVSPVSEGGVESIGLQEKPEGI